MVWKNLKVGSYNLKITALNPIEKDYPYCDKDANLLRKVSGTFTKGHFINDATGEQHDTALRLINNKPLGKLPMTKEVKEPKEVSADEVEDLLIEKQYLVECDILLQALKEKGKAYKFGYSNGNGYKGFKAYLYPSKVYKEYLIMACGTTQISEVIKDIDEIKSKSKKLQSITLALQGINQAKVEDLLEI